MKFSNGWANDTAELNKIITNSESACFLFIIAPTGQTCTVANGKGTMPNTAVTNVIVTCATNAYSLGGSTSGLTPSTNQVVLVNNGHDPISATNGNFTFPANVAEGSTYMVTVKTQPTNQTCTVSHGSGTMGSGPVTGVTVTCNTNAYTLGGTLSGLDANVSVTLANNGSDFLTLNTNGFFQFPT